MLKSFIFHLTLFVILPNQISAILWDGLRVKFGVPSLRNETNSFIKMPTLVSHAVQDGMVNISPECTNGGKYFGFRYKTRNVDGIYLLFDRNGIIAGIQVWMDKSDTTRANNPFRYDLIPMFRDEIIGGKWYTVLTAYFVNPASICSTGRNETSLHSQGTGTGLYFQNGATPHPSNLVNVPTYRPDAAKEGYTNCECLEGMGLHNFWQVEKWQDSNCREVQPIQLLYNLDGAMVGFVFQIFAKLSHRMFEFPPTQGLKVILGPDRTPNCILEVNEKFGTTALHVYFIDNPWELKCPVPVVVKE